MRKIKAIYQVKLFIITALTVLQLSIVETAPNYPLLFVLFSVVTIICIRLLWRSALKDEEKINRQSRVKTLQNNMQYLSPKAGIAEGAAAYEKRAG